MNLVLGKRIVFVIFVSASLASVGGKTLCCLSKKTNSFASAFVCNYERDCALAFTNAFVRKCMRVRVHARVTECTCA